MRTITPDEYDAICNVIDDAKTQGNEDTDAYAAGILAALNLILEERAPRTS